MATSGREVSGMGEVATRPLEKQKFLEDGGGGGGLRDAERGKKKKTRFWDPKSEKGKPFFLTGSPMP